MESFYPIKMYSVYIHKNKINNKIYIGITRQNPRHRWGKNGNGYKNNKHFYYAIQKYGWDNFEHIVLFEALNPKEAYAKEKELISLYKSNIKEYGYNHSVGGEVGSLGIKMSEEAKRKISIANKGKKLSDEAREKDRIAHLGSKNAMFGKPSPQRGKKLGAMSDEQKEKLRDKSKKKKVLCIELDITYDSLSHAERELGINKGSIANACKGRTSSAGKYNNKLLHWIYI